MYMSRALSVVANYQRLSPTELYPGQVTQKEDAVTLLAGDTVVLKEAATVR